MTQAKLPRIQFGERIDCLGQWALQRVNNWYIGCLKMVKFMRCPRCLLGYSSVCVCVCVCVCARYNGSKLMSTFDATHMPLWRSCLKRSNVETSVL